jgi:hypothetical protein
MCLKSHAAIKWGGLSPGPPSKKSLPHLLVNIADFAWAVGLSALAMLAPLAVFGSELLTRMR